MRRRVDSRLFGFSVLSVVFSGGSFSFVVRLTVVTVLKRGFFWFTSLMDESGDMSGGLGSFRKSRVRFFSS